MFALDVAKIDRCFLRKFDFEIRVSAKQCKKGSLPDFISSKQHPALNTGSHSAAADADPQSEAFDGDAEQTVAATSFLTRFD